MSAGRAAVAIARDGNFEIDVHLIRQCRHPGESISELVLLLCSCSFSNCLGQLADFLGKPGNRGRNSSSGVTFSVGCLNDRLQFAESHIDTVNDFGADVVEGSVCQLLERRM